MADIRHETGYKDDYKVVVDANGEWAPTNEEIFTLIEKWFEAEEQAFGGGLGKRMPLFYVNLIALGYSGKAQRACRLEGRAAKEHFERCYAKHRTELSNYL